MNLAEYASFDGLGLAELVSRKDVTPQELAQSVLDGVEKVNPQINAVIEVYPEQANLPESAFLNGPFRGVPLFFKDIGATRAGRKQEMGSRLCRGNVAETDAFLTERFLNAGFNLLGRTTCPEFAFSTATESLLNGPTRNPWDLTRSTGGSSGGSAASVAAGILPIAHASDGLGSIRIPSSSCGIVGLKPSRGRITTGPDAAEALMGMSTEFVVCRTMRDAAAALDAVGKPGTGDPFIIVQPDRPFSKEVGAPPKKLRIAYTTRPWHPFPIAAEIVEAVEDIARKCADQGFIVEEASPEYDHAEMMRASTTVWSVGFDVGMEDWAKKFNRPINRDTLEAITLAFYEYAKTVTTRETYWAETVFNKVRRQAGAFFQKYDLLLTPSLIQLPEPHGKYSQDATDVDPYEFFMRCNESDIFMGLFNVTGQPAISLPLCHSKSGLPIGIQFAARFGEEAELIRIGSLFEQLMPWKDRTPPVHVSK